MLKIILISHKMILIEIVAVYNNYTCIPNILRSKDITLPIYTT